LKSFKNFLEEAANAITRFGSSNHQLKRKGVPHPDHLDMPHIYKWIYGIQKKAKLNNDDKINGEYKKIKNPQKPSEEDLIKGTIPVKKA
tara:strand:+ start:140 stop:406 length:267 start_codon:yes stop_codon:yes gene_type:complete